MDDVEDRAAPELLDELIMGEDDELDRLETLVMDDVSTVLRTEEAELVVTD